jgi:hypothetical protein
MSFLCEQHFFSPLPSERQGSGVRFFEIGRVRVGFKNETPAGQFRKTEHLTPDASNRNGSAKAR